MTIYKKKKMLSGSNVLFRHSLFTLCAGCCVCSGEADSPVETVSSSQHPLVVDQRAATEMSVRAAVQTGLPRPRARRSVHTANDPGVERSDATNCRRDFMLLRIISECRKKLRV